VYVCVCVCRVNYTCNVFIKRISLFSCAGRTKIANLDEKKSDSATEELRLLTGYATIICLLLHILG